MKNPPTDWSVHFVSGNERKRAGDLKGAITDYRRGIALNPDSASAHFALADTFYLLGDFESAIAEYQTCLELAPDSAQARNNLALVLAARGDLNGAVTQLYIALSLDPTDPASHLNLGLFLLRVEGELDQAISEFREALRLNPNLAGAHLGLGCALYAKEEIEGAVFELREAVRLDPNDPDGHFQLGGALLETPDLDGALFQYREAIRLNPSRPEYQTGLALALGTVSQLNRLQSGRSQTTLGPSVAASKSDRPSSGAIKMTARTMLANIVAAIRLIPAKLSGDDSPLTDSWEEIKEQVQHGLSYFWLAYLETIKGTIESAVKALTQSELQALSSELKVPTEDASRIRQVLLRRLLAKARMEKIRYVPFDFEYFWYSFADLSIYTQILKRTGMNTCRVRAYSGAAPFGEEGEINLGRIDSATDLHIMSADEFEEARCLKWPCRQQ